MIEQPSITSPDKMPRDFIALVFAMGIAVIVALVFLGFMLISA